MKDYTQLFNARLSEAIKDDLYPSASIPFYFKALLQLALPKITNASIGLTLDEYEAIVAYANGRDIPATMPIIYGAIQALGAATPDALGLTPKQWIERQRHFNGMWDIWHEITNPTSASIREQVNKTAAEDHKTAQANGGRNGGKRSSIIQLT